MSSADGKSQTGKSTIQSGDGTTTSTLVKKKKKGQKRKSSAISEGNHEEEIETTSDRPVDRIYAAQFGAVHRVVNEYACTLNQTRIDTNNNKFYVIQLLQSADGDHFLYTRWGRVGEDGQHKRFGPMDFDTALRDFKKKFYQKTRNKWENRAQFQPKKGKYTLLRMQAEMAPSPKRPKKTRQANTAAVATSASKLHPSLQEFTQYIFKEAMGQLRKSLNCTFTEEGITTPLGVLSQTQVREGQARLDAAFAEWKANPTSTELVALSGSFYTAVPHKFGRRKPPVLNSAERFAAEYELLELMRDMVSISKDSANAQDVQKQAGKEEKLANVLFKNDVDAQFASLKNNVRFVDPGSEEHKTVLEEIRQSQARSHGKIVVDVVNIFAVSRTEENKRFKNSLKNQRLLYHGSRIANWVGLLSRGVLLPKIVVKMGIARTDGGWLGNGIYFGEADTASAYAGRGSKGTSFILACRVALGRVRKFKKITYGLTSAGASFDSAHGVRGSQFADDEYCVYTPSQQRQEYLCEIRRKGHKKYVT